MLHVLLTGLLFIVCLHMYNQPSLAPILLTSLRQRAR